MLQMGIEHSSVTCYTAVGASCFHSKVCRMATYQEKQEQHHRSFTCGSGKIALKYQVVLSSEKKRLELLLEPFRLFLFYT